MADFNEEFALKIAANDKQLLRDWITEMTGRLDDADVDEMEQKILKRRIRIVGDYLRDDEESEVDI